MFVYIRPRNKLGGSASVISWQWKARAKGIWEANEKKSRVQCTFLIDALPPAAPEVKNKNILVDIFSDATEFMVVDIGTKILERVLQKHFRVSRCLLLK